LGERLEALVLAIKDLLHLIVGQTMLI